jgi:hypothetical protein
MLSESAQRLKKDLKDLWPVLSAQGTYWHSTTVERFRAICQEGIQPFSEQIKSDYPESLGAYFRSICLFDFFSPSEEQIFQVEDSWACFLTNDEPLKVFIGIDKNKLDSAHHIDQNHQRYKSLKGSGDESIYRNQIPFVECWYTQNIPVSAFSKIILIKRIGRPYEYKSLMIGSDLLREAQEVYEEWGLQETKGGLFGKAEFRALRWPPHGFEQE